MLASTPFFRQENGFYIGNQGACGPWSDDACHAGPPAAAFARELELLCDKQLIRLQIDLIRPVPMQGFKIAAELTKEGRSTAYATAKLLGKDGKLCATANGLFHTMTELPAFEVVEKPLLDFSPVERFLREGEASPTARKGREVLPAKNGFGKAVEPICPEDTPTDTAQGAIPGVESTMWMRTPELLPNESMSGFQRVCPLADCINALAANLDFKDYLFMNTDLTVALHRIPDASAEWIGLRGVGNCHQNGMGLVRGELHDKHGSIGTVLQNLLLRSRQG